MKLFERLSYGRMSRRQDSLSATGEAAPVSKFLGTSGALLVVDLDGASGKRYYIVDL